MRITDRLFSLDPLAVWIQASGLCLCAVSSSRSAAKGEGGRTPVLHTAGRACSARARAPEQPCCVRQGTECPGAQPSGGDQKWEHGLYEYLGWVQVVREDWKGRNCVKGRDWRYNLVIRKINVESHQHSWAWCSPSGLCQAAHKRGSRLTNLFNPFFWVVQRKLPGLGEK